MSQSRALLSTHTHTHTHTQETFWKSLKNPDSEKFFLEIHSRFQEAEVEIKNNPMGLVLSEVCVIIMNMQCIQYIYVLYEDL